MSALSAAAKKGLGDPALAELVVIRASQLNHCAFCLDMHLAIAREHGVSERQLDLLAAWEEAEDVFDERERAALALTEARRPVARRRGSCRTRCTSRPPSTSTTRDSPISSG